MPFLNAFIERLVARDVREEPQLYLRIVRVESALLPSSLGMKKRLSSRPRSVLTGMFWRFGSVEDSLPVAVIVWLKLVWMMPVPVRRLYKTFAVGRAQLRQLAGNRVCP